MSRWQIVACAAMAIIASGFTAPVPAQKAIGAKSGVIQWTAGEAFLDGAPVRLAKDDTLQIENGQVLSTKKGYAELILAPAAYLWLGEDASLRIKQNKLSDIQLEITQGSALIEIMETIKYFPLHVHVSKSVLEIKKEGFYRINSAPEELRVHRGDALAIHEKKQMRVKKGRMVLLDGKWAAKKFDEKALDSLHRQAIARSSQISVWMLHSQIEAEMRQAVRVLEDEFQSRMQLQAQQEIQRLDSALWKQEAEQARQEGQRQQEMKKARDAGYDPEYIPEPSQ